MEWAQRSDARRSAGWGARRGGRWTAACRLRAGLLRGRATRGWVGGGSATEHRIPGHRAPAVHAHGV
eukprot:361612-Chlamydomonas_euryale.AAC.7